MHHVECGVALFGKLYPEHVDQQYPAQQAIDILAKVLPKHLMDWTLADFGPISDLPGRAVLALVIVDYTHAAHLGEMQRCLVAQRACSTHPAKLLQIIKDRRKALDFLQVTLATAFPLPLEQHLCPSGMPDLVANNGLHSRIGDSKLTRGDQLQIILPFSAIIPPTLALVM